MSAALDTKEETQVTSEYPDVKAFSELKTTDDDSYSSDEQGDDLPPLKPHFSTGHLGGGKWRLGRDRHSRKKSLETIHEAVATAAHDSSSDSEDDSEASTLFDGVRDLEPGLPHSSSEGSWFSFKSNRTMSTDFTELMEGSPTDPGSPGSKDSKDAKDDGEVEEDVYTDTGYITPCQALRIMDSVLRIQEESTQAMYKVMIMRFLAATDKLEYLRTRKYLRAHRWLTEREVEEAIHRLYLEIDYIHMHLGKLDELEAALDEVQMYHGLLDIGGYDPDVESDAEEVATRVTVPSQVPVPDVAVGLDTDFLMMNGTRPRYGLRIQRARRSLEDVIGEKEPVDMPQITITDMENDRTKVYGVGNSGFSFH